VEILKKSQRTDVLFVGHVPPPWTGQGVIHKMLLDGEYTNIRLVRVPMLFSKESSDQGNISASKVFSLLGLIWKTYKARFLNGCRFLYFSPGGPSFSAVYRDGLYLLATRPIMRGTMLVYHSSGVADYIERLPALTRPLMRRAFSHVELAVQLSESTPPDGAALQAKRVEFIANAVPDEAGGWFPRAQSDVLKILYLGVVAVDKGVLDLLHACRILAEKKVAFEVLLVGAFLSGEEEALLRRAADELPAQSVSFAGPLAGESKKEALRSADVFCFPSFWYTETFPLVLLEALSFGLPVVASRWRGIPDLMGSAQDCGTLVDIHALDQIAAALEALARNPALREMQSRNARLRYENLFTVGPFYEAYDRAFTTLVAG
jgi:glycosyltransferase involved in cell wall biosynthesis